MQTNYEAEQLSMFDQDLWYGKMFPVPTAPTRETTSALCSNRWREYPTQRFQSLCLKKAGGSDPARSWVTDGLSRGERSTLNFGECPSAENASTLSQILVANAPGRYSLSAKACAGILRRAQKRGKALPPMLREALEEAVALTD